MGYQSTTEWVPIGYARFASLSSAVAIATDSPTAGTAYASLVDSFGNKAVPTSAIIHVETQNIRVRSDGTAPTASEGEVKLKDADYIIENSPDEIRKLKIIETSASAQITIRYFI